MGRYPKYRERMTAQVCLRVDADFAARLSALFDRAVEYDPSLTPTDIMRTCLQSGALAYERRLKYGAIRRDDKAVTDRGDSSSGESTS